MGDASIDALQAALKHGVCLEKDLPSRDVLIPKTFGNIAAFEVVSLKQTLEGIENVSLTPENSCAYAVNGPWQKMFPNIEPKAFMKLVETSRAKDVIDKMIALNCQGRRLHPTLKIQDRNFEGIFSSNSEPSKDSEKREILDGQLNKKNPIGISYYSDTLRDALKDGKGANSSVVVGRRFNPKTGACEYLVRNSWGTGFGAYRIFFQDRCEDGNIWMPEDVLFKNLFGTTYVE